MPELLASLNSNLMREIMVVNVKGECACKQSIPLCQCNNKSVTYESCVPNPDAAGSILLYSSSLNLKSYKYSAFYSILSGTFFGTFVFGTLLYDVYRSAPAVINFIIAYSTPLKPWKLCLWCSLMKELWICHLDLVFLPLSRLI